MKKSIIASLLIACSLFIGGNTDARAEYPYDKPINIIVPSAPEAASTSRRASSPTTSSRTTTSPSTS
ncbi:MAG: hypothetical protein ACLR7Z_18360 [Bilophila wadsworthia]